MTVFVFALDGASPDLLWDWIDRGHLPHLANLKQNGIHGNLRSIFPPLTGPAWTSFQTGVNPGKHNVFHWLNFQQDYDGKILHSSDIRSPTIWDIISQQGGKVGSVSLPMTYPPQNSRGYMVSGFLAPPSASNISYPKSLYKELQQQIPEFEFAPRPYTLWDKPHSWVSHLKEVVKGRAKATRYIYDKHFDGTDNELLVTHFLSTDYVQHFLWPENSSNWDPRLEVFQAVDEQIGRIMEQAPSNSTFMIVSDHGFGPVDQQFNINNWLHNKGYLRLKNNPWSKFKETIYNLGISQKRLQSWGEFLYPLARRLNIVENNFVALSNNGLINSLFLSPHDVDWENTVAYSRSDIGSIRLNVQGRDPQGIVTKQDYHHQRSQIINDLAEVRNPQSGNLLTKWIKTKEEVYSGPFLDKGPDILFNPLSEKTVGFGGIMFPSSQVFCSSYDPGDHRRNGVLLTAPTTEETSEVHASIMDIAPTLLNLLSIPISTNMDGKIIREIAPEEPSYQDYDSSQGTGDVERGDEQVKERLQDLGYL